MKKKLCSILLALTMVLTLLPVSALADDGTAVAQIGDTTYTSLQDAFSAAKAGDTVTLLTDVETNNIADTADARIIISQPITLNLNDKKIISPDNMGNNSENFCALIVDADTTINATAQGGINTGTNGGYGINIRNGATLTVNGGTYYGGGTAIQVQKGTLIINDGTFACEPYSDSRYGYKFLINCIDAAWKDGTAKVTVKGGTFVNFDPSDSASENPRGNFCAPGYVAVQSTVGSDTHWTVEDHRVADVNGVGYTTLAAAIAAANAGDTVTLLTNATEKVSISKNLTIDLGGNTLTGGDAVNSNQHPERVALSAFSGTVVVKNGSIDGRVNAYDASDLTIASDVTIKNSYNGDGYDCFGVVVWGDGTNGVEGCKTPKFTLNGKITLENGGIALSTNGNDMSGAVITINKGSVISSTEDGAIYLPSGKLIMNGGTITAPTGIQICAGNANITSEFQLNDGTIIATGDDERSSKGTGDGLIPDGAAISVVNRNYPNGVPTITINGGNFSSAKNDAVLAYSWANGAASEWTDADKYVSISAGTFTSDPTAYVVAGSIARKDSSTSYTVVAKSNLTSGVYTTSPEGALAAGYIYYQNGDGTYTVYYPVPVIPNNNNNSSSTTTKNPDGSTTTTTTDKATGAVTETTTTANGSVGTVKTDANGSTEISVSISAADVKAAEQKNAPVIAPITVAPAASSAAAPVIKLSVPANAGEVAVAIPVVNAKQGTVAVRVNPDGTEEIIKTAVVTENGLVLGVKGSMQIKVINNSKNFADTVGHWAASDVDFVSARELFNGTAPALFSPEASMTRGMVVTVIARLAGENTDGGANWYDKGCAWAVANGVSDGTDPNGSITREQLAAMLYRYCGSPAASGSLSAYADAASVSAFASDAMQWCVNNGIINGMDGLLNPQGQATRAQVSAMFARYIRLAAAK